MQGRLGRWYTQRPQQYLLICMAATFCGLVFIMTPIATAVTSRYEGATLGQWGTTLSTAEPFLALAIGLALFCSRKQLRLVNDWITKPHQGQDIPAIAAATASIPKRMFGIGLPFAALTAEPIGIVTTLHQIRHVNVGDFLLLYVGGLFFSLWGLVSIWIWMELCFRPVLVDLSHSDPTAYLLTGRPRIGVSTRLAVAIVVALTVGAGYAGTLSTHPGLAFSGLWRLLIITISVSIVFGLVLVPLVSALIVHPVRNLIEATREVGRGGLDVHIPVTGNDELGELTASFNTMVDGLRERATLRTRNIALINELRASRERIVAAGDAARRRVESDLHDGAQQRLVTARLKVGLLRRHFDVGDLSADLVTEVDAEIEHALRELRELAHGIYPVQLDEGGLAGALRYAASRAALPTALVCADHIRYRPELEVAVYFCCLEALQNAAKHAGEGAQATITIKERGRVLTFEIVDDGVGFDPVTQPPHLGLQNVTDRIGALGGSIEVHSTVGAGTRLAGIVPIEPHESV